MNDRCRVTGPDEAVYGRVWAVIQLVNCIRPRKNGSYVRRDRLKGRGGGAINNWTML